MKRFKMILSGILISAFSAGCVSTGDFEQMKADIARLYVENNQLRQEVSELKTRVDRMSADLSTAIALKEGQLTLLSQTQDYVKELQNLKGRFEEHTFNIDKRFKELSDKIAELQTKTVQPQAQTQAQKEPEQEKKVEADAKMPKELYDLAHVDIKEKKYASARDKFQEIIKKYPDFELIPNCYFWTAEAYYNEKKYEEAILAYEEFLKKYPKHDKAPGALLKEGMAFLELKDKKTAKVVFERVIERFPNSKEAEIAQQKIAEILKSQSTSTKSKPSKKSSRTKEKKSR
ncbi:tol-pal system protein YbgF [Thermodesulfovibrio hydrogeniphilus]